MENYNNDYCNNDYYNFKKDIKRLGLDSLDLIEDIDIKYYEEIGKYDEEIADLFKLRYKTINEIGLDGELNVQAKLLLLDKNEYKIIHNILIPSYNDKTTQIDSIVISEYGIFVIETKKYNGIIMGDKNSKYWTSYYKNIRYNKDSNPNKGVIKRFYNPIRQNLGHILSLKKLLSKFDNLSFYSIVAFHENADIRASVETEAVYIKDLVNEIKKYRKKVIDKNLVEELYYEILKHKLDDFISQHEHSKYLASIKKREIVRVDKNIKLDYLLTLCITQQIGMKTIELIKLIYNNIDEYIYNIDDLIAILNKCYNINSFKIGRAHV